MNIDLLPENLSLHYTDFQFRNQTRKYTGKVRDVYDLGEQLLVVTTDRISAFDHILPRPIPYKGQVLNQIAAYFLRQVNDIVPTWLIETPDPNVTVGWKCTPVKIEMVVRGYLAGHAWRLYEKGERSICGVNLPGGMVQNQAFENFIITPTTKVSEGHDQDISLADLKAAGLISGDLLDNMCDVALKLFERGTQMAAQRGLILVDTKYEFGLKDNQLYLMDEIHTPDSSRYFEKDAYDELLQKGKPQRQLSKEFVREWLIAHGFQGMEGQLMPEMSDAFVWNTSDRYIELYERITGSDFIKMDPSVKIEERLHNNLKKYL
ncbi:MAG: phosphoribosylaminoimidazolesuccinocarboxamide synthase [Saprospiraceae bacterium]|nr:phosphoribosylaminoimidazolesuccinocarboxamide synthase [Saprospiraceae bacterium]